LFLIFSLTSIASKRKNKPLFFFLFFLAKQLLIVVASLEKRGKKEEINQEAEIKKEGSFRSLIPKKGG